MESLDMDLLLDMDVIPQNCHQHAHVAKILIERMLFIVQNEAIRT